MAGAAPQRRSSGTNATTIVMVVAIIVAVAAIGVLIWLFTQQEQLKADARNAREQVERVMRGGEDTRAKNLFPDASKPGNTVLGATLAGVGQLIGHLTGDQTLVTTPALAESQLDLQLERISNSEKDSEGAGEPIDPNVAKLQKAGGAVTIIASLYDAYRQQAKQVKNYQDSLDLLNEQFKKEQEKTTELQDKFAADIRSLEDKLAELQKGKDSHEQTRNEELLAIKDQIHEKQVQLDLVRTEEAQRRKDLLAEMDQQQGMIDRQTATISSLRGPQAEAAKPLAIARKPLGRILRALPGDSILHVNLGSDDNVTLGMTFSVYNGDEAVPLDGRGKAAVQVVGLGPSTAECRIVSPPPPDDPILEGDAVGNIVLSHIKGKKTRLCFIGGFDVDFDGSPDVRGLDAVKALAKRFGAEVVSEIDARTDYLVVGSLPRDEASAAVKEDAEDEDEEAEADDEDADAEDNVATIDDRIVDPTDPTRTKRAMTARERYERSLSLAERLAIPRLSQDHFFNFIGLDMRSEASKRLLNH